MSGLEDDPASLSLEKMVLVSSGHFR
jgi:hypothetical protein